VITVTATVRSTTGTAPITFDRISPELVMVTLEDGSTQVYRVEDIRKALNNETY
jgi:hypothetical protein